ncbi:hypothetical protein CONPUDRAFT_72248 [Coniophora puteana RWD-64-598 SS2]|uniref:Uncharacterized protein n=1 Tax=Coniophora puteana (strain RWD-64-598) TaxID=741705 RepID=A0A5M3MRU1_CONPW|nr:uncharacterized protein CONPUDRAFT_72248 [Coniophora puteana RWD-64-598 SS2]EIW81873.1 hypothetical protein CONPUDRAFT_72248 [Coniophora puteana RWD-64-598 SS2]
MSLTNHILNNNAPLIYAYQGEITLSYIEALTILIHWVIGSRWRLPRFVFTVARYTSFPTLVVTLDGAHDFYVMPESNNPEPKYIRIALYPVYIASAEILLALRIWASWNRSHKIFMVLCGAAVGLSIAMIIFCVHLGSELPKPLDQSIYMGGTPSCALELPLRVAIEYGFLMAYELNLSFGSNGKVLFGLTTYRWYQFHSTRSRFVRLAYRDALVYLMFMMDNDCSHVSDCIFQQVVVHSIFSTRIWFRLRACAAEGYQSIPLMSIDTTHVARRSEGRVKFDKSRVAVE